MMGPPTIRPPSGYFSVHPPQAHGSCSRINPGFLVYNTTYLHVWSVFLLFNKCRKRVLNPIIVRNCFGVGHPNHSATFDDFIFAG